MVLNYMVSASELADDEVTQRKIEASIAKKPKNKVKIAALFFVLLVTNIFVLTLAYNVWASEQSRSLWEYCCPLLEYLTSNKGLVTGIIYDAENPSAIVCGQVVHEGDVVHGYKVLKIYKEKVELNKKGKLIVKEVH